MTWTGRPDLAPGAYPRGDQIEAILDQISFLTDRMQITQLSGDTAGTSGTTLLDITGLTLTGEAGARYAFEGLILYTAPAANDFSFGITTPSGCTMAHHPLGPILGMVGDDGQARWAASTSTSGLIVNVGGGGASIIGLHWRGAITFGTTAGTLQTQYAAQTAGGTAVVKSGSYLWGVRTN